MSRVRIYLPLATAQLRSLATERRVDEDLTGYAVTDSVRRSDPSGEDESWEYAALQDAAAHCRAAGWPVIVAAADVPRGQVDDRAAAGSQVQVSAPLDLRRVAAFQLGDDAIGGAVTGEQDGPIELSWYDTSELDHLVRLIPSTPSADVWRNT